MDDIAVEGRAGTAISSIEPLQKEGDKSNAPMYDGEIEEYKGKTFDEVFKIIEDSRKTIGRQGTEIGQLRETNTTLERTIASTPPPVPAQAVETPAVEEPLANLDDDHLVSVAEVRKLIKHASESVANTSSERQFEVLKGQAAAAHEIGFATAEGELFEGIKKDVEKVIVEQYQPYLKAGYDISPYLRDPAVWKKAALAVHFNKGNVDMLVKYREVLGSPASTNPTVDETGAPVAPFTGEHPTGRQRQVESPQNDVTFDGKGQFLWRKLGYASEEEAKADVLAERKRRAEGGY